MDSEQLQEAIDTTIFPDIALSIEERRYQAKAVATLKQAARKVANPDYEAAIDRWWAEVGDLMKPTISSGAIDRAVENAIKTALGIEEAPDGQ